MTLARLAAAVGLVVSLAACSSSPAATAADVAFAQAMVPHHEQAVAMSDLALDPARGASPQVQALAEQIAGAQQPEIDRMNGWLQQWGADGTGHSGHDMGETGMMTEQQMADLAAAEGTAFDLLWLEMMIDHHQGAITMAEAIGNSADPDVRELADQIIAAQQSEISTMQGLLQ